MFEMVKEIPVTFGPHAADWWMVGVTIAAAGASFFVALSARTVAKEASDREENFRKNAASDSAYKAREQVAVALVSAINAVDTTSSKARSREPDARIEEDKRVDEALALFSLVKSDVSGAKRRAWFLHVVHHMRGYSVRLDRDSETEAEQKARSSSYETARDTFTNAVADWVQDPAHLNKLVALDFVGPLTRGKDPEICDGFRLTAREVI